MQGAGDGFFQATRPSRGVGVTGPDGNTPPSHDRGNDGDSDRGTSTGDPGSWRSIPPAGHHADGSAGWQSPQPAAPTAGPANSWESFAAAGSGPGHPPPSPAPGSSVDLSGVSGLLSRQFVVPAAALAVAVIAVVISFASSGGGGNSFVNSSSDAEVCSAYRAAERSWDSWDTDATEVERLGSVASKHSDADIRSAGESLNNLTGMFSYGRYSTIVQPIQRLC